MGADINLYDWTGKALRNGLIANPNDGSLLTTPAAGRYAARAIQGHSWSLSMTAAATMVAGNAIGSTQPLVGIWNPPGNKFRASIIRAVAWTNSGTPGGPFVWGYGRNQTLTLAANTGTSAVNNATLVQGSADGILTIVNSATTGLTSVLLRTIGGLTAQAVGTTCTIGSIPEETAGAIVVEPGNFVGIFLTFVGSSHVAGASMEFETISV